MTDLRELPTTIAQFVPKEFLMWLIETRTRINQKLTLISSPIANNVPVITAAGELIDSSKDQPTGDFVGTTDVQTLTNKTLTTPTIASFVNATHNHEAAAGGGKIDEDALALTNVATNDVSITKQGFCPIARNDTTKYLRGDAPWAVVTLPLYSQAAEPDIPVNSIALWIDTDAGPAYYLLADFNGTQKKVALT